MAYSNRHNKNRNNNLALLLPPFVRHPVQWTTRAKSSITPWMIAKRIAIKSVELFPEATFIIDTTACYGNEALAFRAAYESPDVQVLACEWDGSHMKQCQQNVQQDPSCGKILFFEGNSLRKLEELARNDEQLKKTIIICDPCWGGPSYKNKSIIEELRLGNRTIKDLIVSIPAGMWVIKVPTNYDKSSLFQGIEEIGIKLSIHIEIGRRVSSGTPCMYHIFLKRTF